MLPRPCNGARIMFFGQAARIETQMNKTVMP